MLRPRPHLSWSAMTTLERSESAWIKRYLDGLKFTTRAMALGKEIATALESGEETGDDVKDFVCAQMPKLDLIECELTATIKVNGVEIPIMGKLDTVTKDLSRFKEFKTGVEGQWNQKKANEHGQLTFYDILIEENRGKPADEMELVWALTAPNGNGTPELTGEIRKYLTKRTTLDRLKMRVRMKQAWVKIGQICEREIL